MVYHVNMKKIFLSFAWMLVVPCVLLLTACGGDGGFSLDINLVKQKFQDEGYTVITMSNNSLDRYAGAVEGFSAYNTYPTQNPEISVNLTVLVVKFDDKALAEEFARHHGSIKSIKEDVYACTAYAYGLYGEHYDGELLNLIAQNAIDVFDSFF